MMILFLEPYNRIRTGVIPTPTAKEEPEDFYAEHRKSSHKVKLFIYVTEGPS